VKTLIAGSEEYEVAAGRKNKGLGKLMKKK